MKQSCWQQLPHQKLFWELKQAWRHALSFGEHWWKILTPNLTSSSHVFSKPACPYTRKWQKKGVGTRHITWNSTSCTTAIILLCKYQHDPNTLQTYRCEIWSVHQLQQCKSHITLTQFAYIKILTGIVELGQKLFTQINGYIKIHY